MTSKLIELGIPASLDVVMAAKSRNLTKELVLLLQRGGWELFSGADKQSCAALQELFTFSLDKDDIKLQEEMVDAGGLVVTS